MNEREPERETHGWKRCVAFCVLRLFAVLDRDFNNGQRITKCRQQQHGARHRTMTCSIGLELITLVETLHIAEVYTILCHDDGCYLAVIRLRKWPHDLHDTYSMNGLAISISIADCWTNGKATQV
jgi:hypothetical protein